MFWENLPYLRIRKWTPLEARKSVHITNFLEVSFFDLRDFLFSENVFLFNTIICRAHKLHSHVLYVGRGAFLLSERVRGGVGSK